eukprot:GHUV01022603.1.p1 GENE.GHUV01022603.1~~GHUV01022603.1.p1  ORF type:complete len:474 (+),score=108.82 GHUV01022603.1:587-2008(+)
MGGKGKSLKGLWRLARESFGGAERSSGRKSSGAGSDQILVRQVSSSESEHSTWRRTPSPTPTSDSEDAAAEEVWYDCNDDFEQHAEEESAAQAEMLQQAYAALPEQLATIVQRYKQGMSVGCKPTVALIKYMESSGATVQQLQQQLAPLIAAEQAFSYTGSLSGCTAEASTSTGVLAAPGQGLPGMQSADQQGLAAPAAQHAEMSGLAPLQQQLKKKHPQQIQPLQQQPQQPMHDQQQQPCIARLLSNIELVQETLSGMNQWDGFKQVAWGNLEMWYSHDTVNQRQLVKARTVLDEPIVHAVCLAREFDLVPSWNPAILDSRELKAYSPSELLIYILSWCPWPLPCGEVLNYALGVDLLDTKDRCVLLATNTPSEEQLQSIAVPQHPRTLRMIMHAGGFKFIPLPPDPAKPNVQRMEAIVLMSMDAKKFVIPDTIISFLLKIFAPLVYKSVMKVLGSIFHQKNGRLPSGLWCT